MNEASLIAFFVPIDTERSLVDQPYCLERKVDNVGENTFMNFLFHHAK